MWLDLPSTVAEPTRPKIVAVIRFGSNKTVPSLCPINDSPGNVPNGNNPKEVKRYMCRKNFIAASLTLAEKTVNSPNAQQVID